MNTNPAAAGSATIHKVNLGEKFALFNTHWDPKIVAELNGQHVRLAKLQGSFDWHKHDHEDEMFLVIHGSFQMHLRDQVITVNAGEFLVVPHGVEHKPVAEEEVHVMLFEPAATLNTGTEVTARTVHPEWI